MGLYASFSFTPADQLNATDVAVLRSKHKGASCTVTCSVNGGPWDSDTFLRDHVHNAGVACFSSETRRSRPQILHVIERPTFFFLFIPTIRSMVHICTVPHEHVANKKNSGGDCHSPKALSAVHVKCFELGPRCHMFTFFFFWLCARLIL